MLSNSPKRQIKNKVWELYLLYPEIRLSHCLLTVDKTIATHTNFDNI